MMVTEATVSTTAIPFFVGDTQIQPVPLPLKLVYPLLTLTQLPPPMPHQPFLVV